LEVSGELYASTALPLKKESFLGPTHRVESSVGPRKEIRAPFVNMKAGLPVRSQTLY